MRIENANQLRQALQTSIGTDPHIAIDVDGDFRYILERVVTVREVGNMLYGQPPAREEIVLKIRKVKE